MRFIRNKKLFIISTICLIFLIVISTIVTIKEYEDYNNEIDEVFVRLISVIKEEYPDVDEEDIIKNLELNIENENSENNENNKNNDINEILEKYSIDNKILDGIENKKYSSIRYNILIILLGFVLYLLINIIHERKENKTIREITEYIKKINEKKYELKIEENTENELSKLKNELYKITVMLKEEAEESMDAKKTLKVAIEDISHQLKTPLTSMSIMLDNIIENPDMESDTRNLFIHEINRQIKWINWLILSLLKLAKLDSNTIEFEKNNINVQNLVNNVIKNLEIPIDIKEQKIIITGDKNTSFVGDYNWENEAITNVLKNCIEHTDKNKNIYIKFEENNFYTKIEIIDEGNGIDKEDLKHIFKRFYKGKNSSESSIGIGLALAKTIIEKDNGQIVCTSEVNKGTKFEIRYMKNM